MVSTHTLNSDDPCSYPADIKIIFSFIVLRKYEIQCKKGRDWLILKGTNWTNSPKHKAPVIISIRTMWWNKMPACLLVYLGANSLIDIKFASVLTIYIPSTKVLYGKVGSTYNKGIRLKHLIAKLFWNSVIFKKYFYGSVPILINNLQ